MILYIEREPIEMTRDLSSETKEVRGKESTFQVLKKAVQPES
jgi:hypothetical protein